MKLTRSVKIQLSLPKRDLPLPSHDADLPVIHTDQLPKVMGLPREGEITLILKIMYGHNLFDRNDVAQPHPFILLFPLLFLLHLHRLLPGLRPPLFPFLLPAFPRPSPKKTAPSP